MQLLQTLRADLILSVSIKPYSILCHLPVSINVNLAAAAYLVSRRPILYICCLLVCVAAIPTVVDIFICSVGTDLGGEFIEGEET